MMLQCPQHLPPTAHLTSSAAARIFSSSKWVTGKTPSTSSASSPLPPIRCQLLHHLSVAGPGSASTSQRTQNHSRREPFFLPYQPGSFLHAPAAPPQIISNRNASDTCMSILVWTSGKLRFRGSPVKSLHRTQICWSLFSLYLYL